MWDVNNESYDQKVFFIFPIRYRIQKRYQIPTVTIVIPVPSHRFTLGQVHDASAWRVLKFREAIYWRVLATKTQIALGT